MDLTAKKQMFPIIANCTDGLILFNELPEDALADIEFTLIQRSMILSEFEEKGYPFDSTTSHEKTEEYLILEKKINDLDTRMASSWYYGNTDTQELIDRYLSCMKGYLYFPEKEIDLYLSEKEPLNYLGSVNTLVPFWESSLCLCLMKLKEKGYISYNFSTSFVDDRNFFLNCSLFMNQINNKFKNLHAEIRIV